MPPVGDTIHAVAPSLWKRACAQKQRQLLRLFKGLGYGRPRHGRGRRRRDKCKVVDCHAEEHVNPMKDYKLQAVELSDPGYELGGWKEKCFQNAVLSCVSSCRGFSVFA